MESTIEIIRILIPLLLISGISLFVVISMKNKQGTFGKKKSKYAQDLLDSLIPFGLLFGVVASVLVSLFFQLSLLSRISLGAALGLLVGYFAYVFYSKKEENPS